MASDLSSEQKDEIVKSMISVALEDGSMSQLQKLLLAEVSKVLKVPNAHVKELRNDAELENSGNDEEKV